MEERWFNEDEDEEDEEEEDEEEVKDEIGAAESNVPAVSLSLTARSLLSQSSFPVSASFRSRLSRSPLRSPLRLRSRCVCSPLPNFHPTVLKSCTDDAEVELSGMT